MEPAATARHAAPRSTRKHEIKIKTAGQQPSRSNPAYREILRQVMATLRNTGISILRLTGHTNIASANRYHARDHHRPVKLLLNW